MTKDIPVSLILGSKFVTVNCQSSSSSHLFPEGKQECDETSRVDTQSQFGQLHLAFALRHFSIILQNGGSIDTTSVTVVDINLS